MKRTAIQFLIISFLLSCAAPGGNMKDGPGTFRGRWYNYYNRGLVYSEQTKWDKAESDLKKTISIRSKDQRMARTYGMHFIDYFPHRELGIVQLNRGEIDQAVHELEVSINQEKSAKAVFYLNKARKQQLFNQKIKPAPPLIVIEFPPDNMVVSDFVITVKGKVTGEGYISRVHINDRLYRFDLARQSVRFEQEVTVRDGMEKITVVTEDLVGNLSEKTISVHVDREGPTINIFDIVPETISGKENVRITGEVYDSTGIHAIFINDKRIETDDKKSHDFNFVIKRDAAASTLVIKAIDRLQNTTKAELDIEKELTALSVIPEPVLLAFVAEGLFPGDENPPLIKLKDKEDVHAVFVSKYYVAGEVSDDKGVEVINVNDKEIDTRRGRKIFFSKVVGLHEGVNGITVEAYDSSGNRAQSGFSVKRNIPEALQVGSRMSVSILPFDIDEGRGSHADRAYNQLIDSFIEQKRFRVIERAKLEQVLLELKLTREKLTDPDNSVKVGRLIAADIILAIAMIEKEKSIEFISRIINTETSEIMFVKDVYRESKSASSIKELMDGLASKTAAGFPLVRGMIIKKEKKYVLTDLGSKEKIMRDMGLIVYRKGAEIIHPHTGKSLGWDRIPLGEGKFEEIHEEFSKARLSDNAGVLKIVEKDMVITK